MSDSQVKHCPHCGGTDLHNHEPGIWICYACSNEWGEEVFVIADLRRQLAEARAARESLGKFVINYTASLQDSAYDMINSPADRAAIADCLVEWLGGIVAQTRRFIAASTGQPLLDELAEARAIVERFVTHVEAHGADNFYSFTEHIPLLRDAKEALRAAKETMP